MKFAIDIWWEGPEDIEAYKESGALGCCDESREFDTLAEAWANWIEPCGAFHMQLIHYPNYELDEWGDGNILAEGTTDDYIMLLGLGLVKEESE